MNVLWTIIDAGMKDNYLVLIPPTAVEKMKLTSSYVIGNNRYVKVTVEDGETFVRIYEDLTHKSITFTSCPWTQLMRIKDQIDEAIQQVVAKQYVRFCHHVGGMVHVSVTAGYQCADLRVFYQHPQYGPRPNYEGDRTTPERWSSLKELLPQIHKEHPLLANDYHIGW